MAYYFSIILLKCYEQAVLNLKLSPDKCSWVNITYQLYSDEVLYLFKMTIKLQSPPPVWELTF